MLSVLRRKLRRDPLAALGDDESFQQMVHRERLRADRAGLKFAILKLSPPLGVALHQSKALLDVARAIPSRIRETDCVGRFQDGVGVLLLDADRPGAEIVARDLCRGPGRSELRSTIYLYPDSDRESDDSTPDASRGHESELGLADVAPGGVLIRVESARGALVKNAPTWKRALDVAGAVAGLTLLSPLMATTAILVKATSRGPVFFRQQRAGLGGVPFTMYKFRTMRQDAETLQAELRAMNEQDGPAFKIKNDPRITTVGRILRKTCIDELPQLWNVLRGDMSLVGPRPLPVCEASAVDAWSQRRLDVTPGLTCIWQVSGGVEVTFHEWMRMDLAYIRRRSMTGDLGLILRTVKAVLLARASH